MGLKIIGTGRALPARTVSNHELAGFLDTSDEWIVSKTGISSRVVCTTETPLELAALAGQRALAQAELTAAQLDLVICSTIDGGSVTPSLACLVAGSLGVVCPAFDVNGACAGFIYALDLADAYISAGKAGRILIVALETMSRHVDWNDRATCVLFGDGAAACVVTDGGALEYIRLGADGSIRPLLIESGPGNSPFWQNGRPYEFLQMQGQAVFKYAVKTIREEVARALDALRITPEEVDYFLVHQANKVIIEAARTRMRQPAEKFPTNIEKYGNMSSASIPVLLDEMARDGRLKAGDRLVMVAFGAGMTCGACVLVWE